MRVRESDFGAVVLVSNKDLNSDCAQIVKVIEQLIYSKLPELKKRGYLIYEVTVYLSPNGRSTG